MRELFVGLLKLQAWLSPFVIGYYGYAMAVTGTRPEDQIVFGIIGGFLGLMLGSLAWLMYAGLADLAATIWSNEDRLKSIEFKLDQAARKEEPEAKELRKAP